MKICANLASNIFLNLRTKNRPEGSARSRILRRILRISRSGAVWGLLFSAVSLRIGAQCDFPFAVALDNPEPTASDVFGTSVAISGNFAIVGTSGEPFVFSRNVGEAYVFNIENGMVRTIHNPTALDGDLFGTGVAISGNLAVVSAIGYDVSFTTFAGRAYVFDVTTGNLVRTLENPTPQTGDAIGVVAIHGNRAVVGVPNDINAGGQNAGIAHVFDAMNVGPPLCTLINPEPTAGDFFGVSVAISDNWIVVGAHQNDPGGISNAGTVYMFTPTCAFVRKIDNPEPGASDFFGARAGISGDRIVVDATGDDPGGITNAGRAYVSDAGTGYLFDATTGDLRGTLDTPEPAEGNRFGRWVSVSGSLALVGAIWGDPGDVIDAGTAYIFGCPPQNAVGKWGKYD